ncbi:MAG: hypothetical protein ACFBSC_13830 [Microcoleaceae cyanobacterium]
MEELKYLATWVREQHAPEYVLTWLLNLPGIWWSNGEIYQAAIHKSGKRLKEYVQRSKQDGLFKGIADRIVSDEVWDSMAISLANIIAAYQEELVKLQDQGRLRVSSPPLPGYSEFTPEEEGELDTDWSDNLEMQQQPLPSLDADALTGQ